MGRKFALIGCLLAMLGSAAAGLAPQSASAAGVADGGPRWEALTPELKQVLSPVAPEWDSMPPFQRQRLVNAAKHYPQLSPAEQQRFRARLPDWAKLPHDTRNEARDTFRKYRALPTEKREKLKNRWATEVPGASASDPAQHAAASPDKTGEPPAGAGPGAGVGH